MPHARRLPMIAPLPLTNRSTPTRSRVYGESVIVSRPNSQVRVMTLEAHMKALLQLVIIAAFCSPAFAQWANVPQASIPRTVDGKPNLSAPAPRLADGKP